jgi:DNA-binding LacI/PurR family transcriptional regulator
LLARDQPPTAVYVANINQAIGAVAAVRESGRSAPEHISLLCHDDASVCAYLDPPLSAISMPLFELGAASVDALIEQIEGRQAEDIVIPIRPSLVLRRSTGPAP